MKKTVSIKIVSFLTFLWSSTLYAEPSVYGFGREPQETITPTRDTYSNVSSSSSSYKTTLASLQQKVAQQEERIDGLTTIIEGLSASLNQLRLQNNQPLTNTSSTEDSILLKKLGAMIDEIDANYVTKSQLQEALGNTHTSTPKKSTNIPAQTTTPSATTQGKSNATLYREGVRYFGKKRYTDAKKRFMITDTNRYKPAASNYYLGEIAYYTQKYDDAIFYFKKSAGLYDNASYIDTLLLHTGISLEKSGQKEKAKAFYENIVENYAHKKTATIAKTRLTNL